ncbi:hypothetical protein CVT26_012939 [Gymnopilus dilepis]|uniref:Uncharacterized protein n=1 Tax=Gymnopilus dilepis TaxID=231916 RepID=A0A409Y4C4_9AGAR|nr:hypothetical protein CVT26_012939 [Gymnopilus dilepis]
MTIGELVLLGVLDAQSVGRAWVGGGDVVLLPSKEETLKPSTGVQETVTLSARVPVPSLEHSSSVSAEVAADVDSVAEEKTQVESDEGAAEMGAPLLPSPPDSQSSSVRSRSQSHSGSGSGGSTEAEEESAATSEEGGVDDQDQEPHQEDSKISAGDASYSAPSLPERVYSSQSLSQQRVEPPLMITLTSPTVGSPSPTLSSSHPHSHLDSQNQGHRRLASNESASLSTSALPLGGDSSALPPPSSWHGGDATGDGDEGAQKGQGVNVNVKVPRAIYVASGSSSVGTARARSDSRLPLQGADLALSASSSSSSNNLKVKAKVDVGDMTEGERKRAKSHGDRGYDGFGAALRRLGMGMFGHAGGGGGGGAKVKAKER